MKQKTNETVSNREQALAWWNKLSDISIQMPSKSHLCKKYHGDMRIHKSLTGREIEEIWKNETAHIDPSDIESAYRIQVKPNQKVFKEFSKELFQSYINKFSQENKASMLQILIDDLGVRELVDISLRRKDNSHVG